MYIYLYIVHYFYRHWPDEVLYERNPTWGEELSSIFIANHERKYGTR